MSKIVINTQKDIEELLVRFNERMSELCYWFLPVNRDKIKEFLKENVLVEKEMKEEKLGQEPAFPVKLNQVVGQTTYNFTDENGNEQIGHYNNYADISYQGASKRFYAACAAMQGLLANPQFITNCGGSPKVIIEYSYELADKLLRQEEL